MKNRKLDRANKLSEEIKELNYFLTTVIEFDEKDLGVESTRVFMTKKVKTSISLFGSRWYGWGTHEQTIKIPDCVRNMIIGYVRSQKEALEKELEELI